MSKKIKEAVPADETRKSNSNLSAAKKAKNDEFYTQIGDIEDELGRYPEEFWRDKIVYCNCDDCFESNFFKYFYLNFNRYGLKKLITTCYDGSKIAGQEKKTRKAYKIEITNADDFNGDGRKTLEDLDELFDIFGVLRIADVNGNSIKELDGDGDFRSKECLALLEECDVVVTNPPFSLFREFVATLVEYGKYFTIIGNMNAITYKEIFPLIRNNQLWVGYSFNASYVYRTPYSNKLEANAKFVRSKGYNPEDGYVKVPAIAWFTNIPISKRRERLVPDLYKTYSPDEYPTYDNYDAINIDKVSEIPCDYMGVMGVPITFLDKYNPDEFEIVGHPQSGILPTGWSGVTKEFVDLYYTQGNTGAIREGWINPVYVHNGKAVVPYQRILIKRKDTINANST